MNRSEFLGLLKKHTKASRAQWRCGVFNPHSGFLRTGEVGAILCPLTFVCWKEKGHKHAVGQFGTAGRTLRLPHDEIVDIMRAADNWKECDGGLRAEMLEAVGIDKEVAQ